MELDVKTEIIYVAFNYFILYLIKQENNDDPTPRRRINKTLFCQNDKAVGTDLNLIRLCT
jgi:hypothetical protein